MKKTDNQILTRGILKQELRKELRKELKKELKNYTTKEEFNDWMTRIYDSFLTKEEFREEAKKFMTKEDGQKIMTILDYIVKNIDDLRAENAAHIASYQRLENGWQNHEKRIISLEQRATIA